MKGNQNIPVYNLDNFRKQPVAEQQFQVEVFDANRHFEVSYPHKHNFYEVLFLTQGSGYHIIDANRYTIEPPTIFFLSPGQAHKLELSKDVNGFLFLFTSEFYLLNQANKNRLLELPFFFSLEQKNPPIQFDNTKDVEFLTALFRRGCELFLEKTLYYKDSIRTILDTILQICFSLYPKELQTLNQGKSHFLVKSFLLLLEDNFQKNLRINDYANMLSVTPNHLTQTVKQITGKTTAKLLQERIVAEVKRLLLHTDYHVSEIADIMNFPDQSYFSKFFKKHTGVSPGQYRAGSR